MAVVPYSGNSIIDIFNSNERVIDIGLRSIRLSQRWSDIGVAGVLWDTVRQNFNKLLTDIAQQ
jgi:hypothetical protein